MAGSFKTAYRFCLLAILLCAACSGNDADQAQRPNILLILTDDLGNNDIASWGDGQAPTPTLDKLSRDSVRFRQHYTDSTCSPSRAALITGREPMKIGFAPTGLGLSPDVVTLPEQLKGMGYRTIHLGKWHVGEALEYPEIQPSRHGFDYWFGMLSHFVLQGPGPHGEVVRRRPTHINPWLQDNGAAPKHYQGYLDDILTEKAIEQLHMDPGKPWFINLWLYSPHTPYQPSPQFAAKFPATPEGKFLAVMAQLDHNMARLLRALDESGQADNTIVVFASDNGGPNIARDNNWPFQGSKGSYLEGGQRTPLLLRWPKHFTDEDILPATTIMDIFPTLVELAGGQVPQNIDGQSLVGLMRKEPFQSPKHLFFAADAFLEGMSYGGRSFAEGRLFYRKLQAPLISAAIAPPIGRAANPEAGHVYQPKEAKALIRQWESVARQVPTSWQSGQQGEPGVLRGSDFQRAPVFEGFSMGLSLSAPATMDRDMTLIDQPGVWSVQLLQDRRLRIVHGAVEQFSRPITEMASCNRLVLSANVKAHYTFPFPMPAQARLSAYWNDEQIMDSEQLLKRPVNAAGLALPTFIGAREDTSGAFPGRIERPVIINKFLQPKQDGFGLKDFQQLLCTTNK